jgi:hypothetical protein
MHGELLDRMRLGGKTGLPSHATSLVIDQMECAVRFEESNILTINRCPE